MEALPKLSSLPRQKRKRKSKTKISTSEHKNMKISDVQDSPKIVPLTTVKAPKSAIAKRTPEGENGNATEDFGEKYPVLKNQELVTKFLKVQMTNNQKGRIRQAIKESLRGTSSAVEPEIIHNKIQAILKNSTTLTDSDLRRIRILYNLLKTALKEKELTSKISKPKTPKAVSKTQDPDSTIVKEKVKKEKKDKTGQLEQKVRGPKRYIVFLGNLPLDVDKQKIINHFSEMNEQIVDIRIPKPGEGKKSAIAYLELSNEPSYEFALSKHHSMLGNKRINVLYTAPKNGKVSKDKAKSKTAKLIALQRTGKLVGSIPLAKKRSQRRLKMKRAQAKLAAETA